MVLTAYVGLSPVTGLFCHRRLADIVLSKPGWANRTPQNLTPASGRQDHTILPSATTSLVSVQGNRSPVFRPALRSHRAQNAAASTASHPAFVTIMIRPSSGVDMKSSRGDLGGVGTEIFFGKPEIRLGSPVKKPPDGQISPVATIGSRPGN
jgi:hypothetical protein